MRSACASRPGTSRRALALAVTTQLAQVCKSCPPRLYQFFLYGTTSIGCTTVTVFQDVFVIFCVFDGVLVPEARSPCFLRFGTRTRWSGSASCASCGRGAVTESAGAHSYYSS